MDAKQALRADPPATGVTLYGKPAAEQFRCNSPTLLLRRSHEREDQPQRLISRQAFSPLDFRDPRLEAIGRAMRLPRASPGPGTDDFPSPANVRSSTQIDRADEGSDDEQTSPAN